MKKYLLSFFYFVALIAIPSKVFAATSISDMVTDYLPYVLIGGAVILLVSIIGILFSKKKDKGVEPEKEVSATPVETVTPTLQPKEDEKPEINPINMDEISSNLYAPTTKPTIQETMESNTVAGVDKPTFAETNLQMPIKEQSDDLQDILQGEISTNPMTPVTSQSTVEETPTPVEPAPVADINTAQPIPDIQQFVNTTAAEVPPTIPTEMPQAQVAPITPEDLTTPTSTTTIGG